MDCRVCALRNVTKFREKWNEACGSVLLLKQKKPIFLAVFLVFMSFSNMMLENQHKLHCSLPQLRRLQATCWFRKYMSCL